MKSNPLIVYGASGHGKVVADAAGESGWRVVGFADDDPDKRGQRLLGLEVVAIGLPEVLEICRRGGAQAVVGIGDNAVRREKHSLLVDAGVKLATVIHPSATIARSVEIGEGTVIFAGVVVNADTVIGRNVILNTSSSIDHDSAVGDHAHVSPGAHLGGTVVVGQGTHVGLGSSVRNNVSIGAWSVVGMGSAVVKPVGDGVIAFGVPARVAGPARLRE